MVGKLKTGPKPRTQRDGQTVTRNITSASATIDVSFDENGDLPPSDIEDAMPDVALSMDLTGKWEKQAFLVGLPRFFEHSGGVQQVYQGFSEEHERWAAAIGSLLKDCGINQGSLYWPGVLKFDGKIHSFEIDMSKDFPHKHLLTSENLLVHYIMRS